MYFSGLPIFLAAAVCLSSVLPTRGILQYVGDQQPKFLHMKLSYLILEKKWF